MKKQFDRHGGGKINNQRRNQNPASTITNDVCVCHSGRHHIKNRQFGPELVLRPEKPSKILKKTKPKN